MNLLNHRAIAVGISTALTINAAHTEPMRLSTNGTGQVLLYPYYIANESVTPLISIVNTTNQAKALRINVREARGGRIVYPFNLFLSPKDVWTAAVLKGNAGATIFTADKSCTNPRIPSSGLSVSTSAFQADSVQDASRTLEGYIEVIEMASIPTSSALGKDVTHINGVPNCLLVRNESATLLAANTAAPSGGLTGTLTLVAAADGTAASVPTTAIENYWRIGSNAFVPRVAPITETFDLSATGGNTWAEISTSLVTQYSDRADPTTSSDSQSARFNPATVIAQFETPIDTLSALLMTSNSLSEYADTSDDVIKTVMVATQPTKPYYIYSTSGTRFYSPWQSSRSMSCDEFSAPRSADREGNPPLIRDEFAAAPPLRLNALCFVASPLLLNEGPDRRSADAPFSAGNDRSLLRTALGYGIPVTQNLGVAPVRAGQEGGWGSLSWKETLGGTRRVLRPREATTLRIVDGVPRHTPTSFELIGLPVIGFTFSQYRASGSAGQTLANYADIRPLTSRSTAVEVSR